VANIKSSLGSILKIFAWWLNSIGIGKLMKISRVTKYCVKIQANR
jgi:hypothetical protein